MMIINIFKEQSCVVWPSLPFWSYQTRIGLSLICGLQASLVFIFLKKKLHYFFKEFNLMRRVIKTESINEEFRY